MYSPDSIGLGHIRRLAAIASRIVTRNPNASVLMIVGSGVGAFFDLPTGVDCIKLPSVQKIGRNAWKPRSLGLSAQTTGRLRAAMIRETIELLEPDALLVDHAPAGIWNELLPTLQLISDSALGTCTVLGLRDILDEPKRIRRKWTADGTYSLIRRHYDHVFIYGVPEVYPAADYYGLNNCVRGDLHYCGYVSEEARLSSGIGDLLPAELIARPGKRLAVVTAGGGHDAFQMMSACIAAMLKLGAGTDLEMVAITGPLMPPAQRDELRRQACRCAVTIVPWTKQPSSYLAAADVIVTMGGYNSVLEALAWSKPTIVIPRDGPTAEQSLRAAMFDRLGQMTYVPLAKATPAVLAEILLQPPTPSSLPKRLPLEGAERAAELLLERLPGRRRATASQLMTIGT
jgi:predicted glycosyltransferase